MRNRQGYHREPQRLAQVKAYNASPQGRYQAHKLNAKTRGVEFSLTFDEWWALWEPRWAERGRGFGKYHMSRVGDIGPYAIGNVFLSKHEENCKPLRQMIGEDEQVEMANRWLAGESTRSIAKDMRCSPSTVGRLIRGRLRIK